MALSEENWVLCPAVDDVDDDDVDDVDDVDLMLLMMMLMMMMLMKSGQINYYISRVVGRISYFKVWN